MAGSTWTNPDQVVFLSQRLVPFVEAQNAKTLTAFWTDIWRDFFRQWPTPDSESVPNGLDPTWNGEQKASKKRKKNHTETEGTTGDAVNTTDDMAKWLGLCREVSIQIMILVLYAYFHLRVSRIGISTMA